MDEGLIRDLEFPTRDPAGKVINGNLQDDLVELRTEIVVDNQRKAELRRQLRQQ